MTSSAQTTSEIDLERVLGRLAERARHVPFVTLVEHLERVFRTAPRVGTTGFVRDEVIRFRHDPRLIFHSSDTSSMRVVHGRAVEITATFIGATGAVSPLANYFTEDVLRAESQDADALRAFYDLFHHRLLALCYRAIRRRTPVSTIRTTADDPFTTRALALTGLGPRRADAALSSVALLGRARIFSRRPRSKEALEAALALAFPNVRISVDDFFSRRVSLADDQRLRLGIKNHRLGREARIGRNMSGQSGLLRVSIGPVDRTTFDAFLPGGAELPRLRAIVDDIVGGMLDAEADIELSAKEEFRSALGSKTGTATRLGRTSLVRAPKPDRPLRARVPLTGDEENARPVFL